jgi:hypothetical protein
MKNRGFGWSLLGFLVLGCGGTASTTSRPAGPPPTPIPQAAQLPGPVTAGPTAWTFKYSPGVLSYRISRSAAIESAGPDSVQHRETSSNITHELLTLKSTEEATKFTAVLDTFATTTQGLIGTVRPVELPVQISGSLTDSGLTINNGVMSDNCNALGSLLITDLHNLLVTFPVQMATGTSWRDSADVSGCQAGVPTSTHTARSYVVSGEVLYEGRPVLVIQRTDTTRASGEGGLQQHHVLIDARGTGTALYYLETSTGQIVHLTVSQLLTLEVTASGRRFRFTQESKQDFSSVR